MYRPIERQLLGLSELGESTFLQGAQIRLSGLVAIAVLDNGASGTRASLGLIRAHFSVDEQDGRCHTVARDEPGWLRTLLHFNVARFLRSNFLVSMTNL